MFNTDKSSQLDNLKVCRLSCFCPMWRRGSVEGFNPSHCGISSSQQQPRVKTLKADLHLGEEGSLLRGGFCF